MAHLTLKQHQEIDAIAEEIGSTEALWALMSAPQQQQVSDAVAKLRDLFARGTASRWKELLEKFYDYQRWSGLAQAPASFDAELERVFSEIRAFMKTLYGIPNNRPRTNTTRDKQILEFRKQNLSFGEIGLKLNIPSNTTERAYSRLQQDQKKQLRDLLAIMMEIANIP